MKSLSKTLLLSIAIVLFIGGLGAVTPVLAEKSNAEVYVELGAPVTGGSSVISPSAIKAAAKAAVTFSTVTVSLTKDLAGAELQSRMDSFVKSVSNGNANQITGLYVDGVLANQVTLQPNGNAAFVSEDPSVVTKFGMAADYGSTAFLAHNYLAGAVFFDLNEGQIITLVYGNGATADFQIQSIRHFQALSPNSPYSDFVDLDNNSETLSAADLFYQMYNSDNPVVLQTCIANEGISSWGRLFVIAVPVS